MIKRDRDLETKSVFRRTMDGFISDVASTGLIILGFRELFATFEGKGLFGETFLLSYLLLALVNNYLASKILDIER